MKRSRIFLGIMTGVLAVVAFTAAKTTKYTTKVKGYITSSTPACTAFQQVSGFIKGTDGYQTNGSGARVNEFTTASSCNTPLYKAVGRSGLIKYRGK
jgi:hypothetical protein